MMKKIKKTFSLKKKESSLSTKSRKKMEKQESNVKSTPTLKIDKLLQGNKDLNSSFPSLVMTSKVSGPGSKH